ncbi:WD repeat-containing protein 17-like [Acanthaster planci]|uniref:WD repeat-containing protein 17-like n=1 Tax=Acanthaster planci TaxID=133434 RepID=A0A8B7ZVE3_ACAPL|nr:WD repeat-containing protein 17-like [Acanthaster planci]XP_022109389.1 WD repeat-containing protein 17-like [Acanthaster planci]
MKQVGLLSAGCQPWNSDVVATSGDRFAYCATLAIYVYQLDRDLNEFKLHAIMSEHKKTVTAIRWHPTNPDLFASAGCDCRLYLWDVARQCTVATMEYTKCMPKCLDWCLLECEVLTFIQGRGPLMMWQFHQGAELSPHREAQGFASDVCKFRWHHKNIGKAVFGHADGSLSFLYAGGKIYRHVVKLESTNSSEEDDPVIDLEWDPLSDDYLLVANRHLGVRLIDGTSRVAFMKFELPSAMATVKTLAWVPSAPGMFVTGDTSSGVLRLWGVSKSTPILSLGLKKMGFHALKVFSTSPSVASTKQSDTPLHRDISSTSQASPPPSANTLNSYRLPPGHAVCTFLDGGVGLYDFGKRRWDFLRELGHVETIFDCKFKPDDANLIATASFDGTMKVWDINTLTAVQTSPGNEGVIYCLSWAPADLNCIVAATSKNGAFIWDLTRGRIIKRFLEHGKNSVYSVAWNQKDPKRIASCGGDHYCIVREADGKLLQKYRHPASVFGCDWSPNNKDMIATGCDDGKVRVFYIATATDQPLKAFLGHVAKVFNVKWSPLREGILCSGSDDGTIRVWDYTQDSCIIVLEGHRAPVRGLLWNPEVPYLLISGSWDYTIRVWDTRDGACLDNILDHGADVYGLTSHPNQPFVLASCSRDSTLRIWSLAPLVTTLQLSIIARRPLEEIIGTAEHSMAMNTSTVMAGRMSRELKQKLEQYRGDLDNSMALRWFSHLFSPPGGSRILWELVSILNGQDDSLLPDDYSKGIMHAKHLVKFKASEAQELEMARMARPCSTMTSAKGREEKLREAASIHIRLGQVHRYCELMVEIHEWEKALSIAPAVSMDYWRKLSERYANFLASESSNDCVPYYIATGNIQKLVDFFSRHNQLKDAMLVAQVACEEGIEPATERVQPSVPSVDQNGLQEQSEENVRCLNDVSCNLAKLYFQDGHPIMAACCHMAVGNTRYALSKLIRGHELELAISVGRALEGSRHPDLISMAAQYLTLRCQRMDKWDLGLDILNTLPDHEGSMVNLCARCVSCSTEVNFLHQKAGLPSLTECTAKAQELEANGDVECVKYYLLSTTPERALELGISKITDKMCERNWTLQDVLPMITLLSNIRNDVLLQKSATKERTELLILSHYLGALRAIRRGYHSIVVPLLEKSRSMLMKKDLDTEVDVPLTEEQVQSELDAWTAQRQYEERKASSPDTRPLSEAQTAVYNVLIQRVGAEETELECGIDLVAGSRLPCHSDVHMSFLTGARIQGPVFFLEDGKSAIALNDALMWAKVNPFSPLGTGATMNPF